MLEAISADARIIPILFGQPFSGAVHSIFATAVNFTGDDGTLYCLATAGHDDAPATVRLRTDTSLDSFGIAVGDAVAAAGGVLACGPLAVTAAGIRPWAAVLPPFPAGRAGRGRLAAGLDSFRRVVAAHGTAGGLWAFGCDRPGDGLLARELAARAGAFCRSLADGPAAGALAAGRRLLGLGGGLTPAGDDFLAGLLLTFRLPAVPFGSWHHELAAALAVEAAAATGAISRAMLRHAADGWAAAGAVAVLAALTKGGEAEVEDAARHLLATGATSGTDLAVGLAAGLALAIELAERGGKTDDRPS